MNEQPVPTATDNPPATSAGGGPGGAGQGPRTWPVPLEPDASPRPGDLLAYPPVTYGYVGSAGGLEVRTCDGVAEVGERGIAFQRLLDRQLGAELPSRRLVRLTAWDRHGLHVLISSTAALDAGCARNPIGQQMLEELGVEPMGPLFGPLVFLSMPGDPIVPPLIPVQEDLVRGVHARVLADHGGGHNTVV